MAIGHVFLALPAEKPGHGYALTARLDRTELPDRLALHAGKAPAVQENAMLIKGAGP